MVSPLDAAASVCRAAVEAARVFQRRSDGYGLRAESGLVFGEVARLVRDGHVPCRMFSVRWCAVLHP